MKHRPGAVLGGVVRFDEDLEGCWTRADSAVALLRDRRARSVLHFDEEHAFADGAGTMRLRVRGPVLTVRLHLATYAPDAVGPLVADEIRDAGLRRSAGPTRWSLLDDPARGFEVLVPVEPAPRQQRRGLWRRR